jgi:hypothetical protein
MSPEQALSLLAQVAAQCALPKAGHIQVEQALAVLAAAIKKEDGQ